MATQTFRIGDTIVHRIIEMECGFTPALEFLPTMTPEMLADSRPWPIRIASSCASRRISSAPASM